MCSALGRRACDGVDPVTSLQVALDATALCSPARTGVGRYVQSVLDGLGCQVPAPQIMALAFTWRGRGDLAGARWVGGRVPARVLQQMWLRGDVPSVEMLAPAVRRADLLHAPAFVAPPTRLPVVLTVHDLAFWTMPDVVSPGVAAYRQLVPASVARAQVVCTPTQVVADQLCAEFSLDPAKVVATGIGLGTQWTANRAEPTELAERRRRLALPERYFAALGTIEPRKNLTLALAAHAQLRRAEPDVPDLVLIGGAGWGSDLDAQPGVRRLGFVDDADAVAALSGARALLMPTREEGFGIPIVEALSCGVAVVCSDLPVLREVAGAQARFLPVDDVDAWSHELERLAGSDDTEAAVQARRDRAQLWSTEAMGARVLAAYELALR